MNPNYIHKDKFDWLLPVSLIVIIVIIQVLFQRVHTMAPFFRIGVDFFFRFLFVRWTFNAQLI